LSRTEPLLFDLFAVQQAEQERGGRAWTGSGGEAPVNSEHASLQSFDSRGFDSRRPTNFLNAASNETRIAVEVNDVLFD
jgi:hypothetical protein